jgi:hypothetical protein
MSIKIHDVAHHRNGISGEGFYTVTFTDTAVRDPESRKRYTFVATVFPPDPITDGPMEGEPDWHSTQGLHAPRIAVLAIDLLPSIAFGHNSWRGDNYQDALYTAILEYREQGFWR